MSTLYLHIGTPKTGTSYIQNFLVKNNSVLMKQQFIYPDFKVYFDKVAHNRNAHFLINMITNAAGKRQYSKEKKIEKSCLEQCFQLFNQYPNIILSDESIWTRDTLNRGNNFWEYLKQRLDARNVALKVIVYLRRQDLYIQSLWAQKVKKINLAIPIHEYIESTPDDFLDYYKKLQEISQIVGKDNIIVRAYETGQFVQEKISADFLYAIGLTYDSAYKELKTGANYSLTGIYLAVKQELDKTSVLDNYNYDLYTLLRDVMLENNDARGISSSEFLSCEECRAILDKYKKSNEAIARDFLGREDGQLFYDTAVRQKDQQAAEYELTDYVKILAQLLLVQGKKLRTANERYELLQNKMKPLDSTPKPDTSGGLLEKLKTGVRNFTGKIQ